MNLSNNKLAPWPFFDEEQIEIVQEILSSGKVNYWTGDQGMNFEKEFAEFCGTKYAVAISNGSLALSAAYISLNLQPGDEVITTPRTFIATSSSAALLNLVPVFADIDKSSGSITAETIEPLITPKTKAISVVHLGGWPADMEQICRLAKIYDLKVIEDCSQAHGAYINNKHVGSFGDVGTWSFCQDKIMTTGGEGGMITTNNKSIYRFISSFKDHGKNLKKKSNMSTNGVFRWIHDEFGTNLRMTEMQSALGRAQLKKLKEWNKIRRRNANIMQNVLSNISAVRIPEIPSSINHAWYKLYVYLELNNLSKGWSREKIVKEINKKGFPASSGSCSEIYLEKCFKNNSSYSSKHLTNAKLLGETSLMFLIHPTISEEQMFEYSQTVKNILINASS